MKNTQQPICITFAGPIGSSKTPIANYLSTKLDLPVFNNDAIRSEVAEDLGRYDIEEHLKRRNTRLTAVINSGISFICDASVDRGWDKLKSNLEAQNYQYFVISLDLSEKLLTRFMTTKKYDESLKAINQYILDHENFLKKYADDISLHITDDDFLDRLKISLDKTSAWIESLG